MECGGFPTNVREHEFEACEALLVGVGFGHILENIPMAQITFCSVLNTSDIREALIEIRKSPGCLKDGQMWV